jgi:hypothetical protein
MADAARLQLTMTMVKANKGNFGGGLRIGSNATLQMVATTFGNNTAA